MKITTVTKKLMKEVIATMSDWYGIHLTEDQLKEIFKKNKELALDVVESQLDTVSRESMTSAIAKYVGVNREWPCGYMGKAYSEDFFKEFYTSCITSGIRLDEKFLEHYLKEK